VRCLCVRSRRCIHGSDVARMGFEQKRFSSASCFKSRKNFLPTAAFQGIRQFVPRRLSSSAATAALLTIFTTIAYAQSLAPSKLAVTASQPPPAKKDSVQVITKEAPEVIVKETPHAPQVREPQVVTKEPQVITKENQAAAAKEMPSVVTKQKPEVISKPAPKVAKEKKPKIKTTPISEPIRPIAQYTFKSPEGQRESVPVISHYYPNQIVHPLATTDKHIDPKLLRAASIAEKSELARDAAADLVSNYGFKKLSVHDPFAAPIGSVLVYGTSRSVGHVELRTRYGFVSDFRSPTPSRRPLIGVYAKL
jgi:outer membrane biosynthesis protein TonB